MDQMEEGRVGRGRNIQSFVEIEMAIVKRPVQKSGSSEQGRSLIQGCKGFEDKGIRGREGLDVAREGEVEGIDDHRIWEDGGVCIVGGGIQVILLRKGISRSHLCPWGNLPDDVTILEKEGPASLATREFAWILEVG